MSRWMPMVRVALRLALGVMFIYASVHKIVTPGSFAQEINNYRLLPPVLINPAAIVVPWLEMFCGLALLTNRFALGASALVAIMMTVFTAAVASVVARHLNVSCGCFKSGGSAATWLTVARDIAFSTGAILNLMYVWPMESWNSPT